MAEGDIRTCSRCNKDPVAEAIAGGCDTKDVFIILSDNVLNTKVEMNRYLI